ncbi:MAG: lipoate--protein ligase family protein [Planctomycetes bacterium]|nr:lipoate--protein ligase family protein [Planctomycetota bacterium]
MERWRLITTWGAEPSFNMGLDEALLESDACPPTLRFYTWKPDTLSLGYFQKFADVPGAEKAGAIVRRITGGGAIHHVKELTFSIAAPLDHPLYRGPVGESYARIHGALVKALADAGVEGSLRGGSPLASDRAGTGMCFHHSTALDVAWGGKKGIGSAQRRKKGRVLHHGSIKLGTSPLEGDIATLDPKLGVVELAGLVRAVFEREFELAFEASVPDADERLDARRLGTRYLDPEFVRGR